MITPSAQKSSAAENPVYDRALRYLQMMEKEQPCPSIPLKKQASVPAGRVFRVRKNNFLTRI